MSGLAEVITQALCRRPEHSHLTWFPDRGQPYRHVRAVCRRCPIQQACLEMAMRAEVGRDVKARHGMFGAHSPRERWALERCRAGRCRHPRCTSANAEGKSK